MCESCESDGLRRREFPALSGAMGASVLLSSLTSDRAVAGEIAIPPLAKKPARVLVAFLYPPADAVTPDDARRFKAFARMYRLKLEGNV